MIWDRIKGTGYPVSDVMTGHNIVTLNDQVVRKKFFPSFRSRTEFRWLRCSPKCQSHSFPYNSVQQNTAKRSALVVWLRTMKHDAMFASYVQPLSRLVESGWNVMVHGDPRMGEWRGNWQIQWVASTLHTTSEHGVSNITTADAHTSAASSRPNWCPCRFKWTRPFRRKTKSDFCACAVTLQRQSTIRIDEGYCAALSKLVRHDTWQQFWKVLNLNRLAWVRM